MSKVQIVWFRDLVRWDTEYFTGNHRLESKFKLVDLSEILIPRKERIKPNEYDGITPIVAKIPFSNPNIELRKEPKTKMDMYAVYKNDLLVSNINFHQGAVAICRENRVFASTHYQPYIVNTDNIDLEFLVLVLRQNSYQEYISAKKIRGIKTESNFNFIKTLQIPLPPLEVQKQIVAKIESIKAQIKALQVEEKRLKDEIEAYIYIALGLEKKQEAQRQKVFIVRFKDLDRWDTRHHQANQHAKTQVVFESLENLTTYMQRGKTPTYSSIKKYPVIAQKCVQWNGLEIQKALFINPDSLSSYTKERFLQDDDILLNSTGIGTLGRAIIYKSKDNPYNVAVADGHITVMRFDTQRILPQYFYHYFSSALIQDNIEEYATGSTKQKELSLTLIKQIKIPLPPLSVQEKIVNAIEMIKAQIAIIDSKLESLEARKAQILESALSEGNERERERENRQSLKKS